MNDIKTIKSLTELVDDSSCFLVCLKKNKKLKISVHMSKYMQHILLKKIMTI
jgi:hypothetical protein